METNAAGIEYYVDQPEGWESLPRCVTIRGWCFPTDGGAICAIRLRTEKLTVRGSVGHSRPDVKATLPQAPDDSTGFEIRATLPSGRCNLSLEAGLADGTWHELVSHPAMVQRQLLPLWVGGGRLPQLITFQTPTHAVYAARPVRKETFGAPASPVLRPKLSIVTPAFQQARFIGETMRSVLDQTGLDCEYVVQDGGSTDGSVEIIRRLAEHPRDAGGVQHEVQRARLATWASERDSGQADAIARAFAKTSGRPDDLMAWINSDDHYLPGALAFVASYFARHPEVDVLYGHRILINEESQEIARWFLPKHDEKVLRLYDFVPQETLFWRRRIWNKVGGLDTSLKFAMDWDLLLRFQAAGAQIVRVPYFLACFRVHPAQKTSAVMQTIGQKEIDLLRARSVGRAILPESLEANPHLIRYLRRSAFIEFLWKLGWRAS